MLFDDFRATARPVVMGPGVRRDDGGRGKCGAPGRHHHRIHRMATVTVTTPHDAVPGAPLAARLSTPQVWGIVMLMPYLLVFLAFVVYPVCYGLWLARHPSSYVALYNDPIFARAAVNTLIFLVLGINFKMLLALFLSGFFIQQRSWIKWLSVLFILPWAVPSIPTILSVRFMLNPEWGMINQLIFKLTGEDGPNWLNDPTVALTMAIVVHIWKSLPFWTLILMTGRLAIAQDLFEAADVDGASWWQKFRFVTWPSVRTLYLTCTLLSMIWTLGDFNSVYLLTGGGPADLTHVLSTLGIRYLRLDQLDLSMAAIVCALPLVLPLVYFMMKRLSR
jgi:multiple sugar transport system permease protein